MTREWKWVVTRPVCPMEGWWGGEGDKAQKCFLFSQDFVLRGGAIIWDNLGWGVTKTHQFWSIWNLHNGRFGITCFLYSFSHVSLSQNFPRLFLSSVFFFLFLFLSSVFSFSFFFHIIFPISLLSFLFHLLFYTKKSMEVLYSTVASS